MANRKDKKRPGENMFISPLNDDIVKAVFGDQKNIHNTEALLKPIIGIPPEDYAGMRVVPSAFFRRWRKDKSWTSDSPSDNRPEPSTSRSRSTPSRP
jgi:hypothetical protein